MAVSLEEPRVQASDKFPAEMAVEAFVIRSLRMVEVLELRIADNLASIFAVLEDVLAAEAYIQVYFSIMMVCIPDVVQHLRSIAQHDLEQARHLRQSIVERLRGPPNRPTVDPTERVLGFALGALRELVL